MNVGKFDPKLFSELSTALGELENSSARVASIAQQCRHSLEAYTSPDSVVQTESETAPVGSSDATRIESVEEFHPRLDSSPTAEQQPLTDRRFGDFQKRMGLGSSPAVHEPSSIVPPAMTPVPPAITPAPPRMAPIPPPAPKDPWWTDDKKVVKVIAIIGGLITAAGIAFLVALAIQAGLLGPGARVALTYALAIGLGAIAVWAHRREAPLVTVASLMVTGLATANLTTTAVVRILRWIPPEAGLVLILVASAVAFYGARWTKSPATLAWSILLGNGFMWSITSVSWNWGVELRQAIASLIAFALMAVAIAAWWNMGRNTYVAGFVLAGNIAAGYLAMISSNPYAWLDGIYMAIFTVLQLGPPLLVAQVFASRRSEPTEDEAQTDSMVSGALDLQDMQWLTRRETKPNYAIAIASAAITPLLMLATCTDLTSMFVAGTLSIAYISFGVFNTAPTNRYFGHTASVASMFPWLMLAFSGVDEGKKWAVIPIAVAACAATWMLVYPPKEAYKSFANVAAAAWLGGANISMAYLVEPAVVEGIARSTTVTLPEAIGLLFLFMADIGLVLAAARQIIPRELALLGLVLTSLPFIHLLMLMGIPFTVAHMLLSISWVALAGILVLSPRFQHVPSRLAAGLTIAILSVAKLILFDMANLDGFVRALAFIVCGLILLAMAVFGAKQQKELRKQPSGDVPPAAANPERFSQFSQFSSTADSATHGSGFPPEHNKKG